MKKLLLAAFLGLAVVATPAAHAQMFGPGIIAGRTGPLGVPGGGLFGPSVPFGTGFGYPYGGYGYPYGGYGYPYGLSGTPGYGTTLATPFGMGALAPTTIGPANLPGENTPDVTGHPTRFAAYSQYFNNQGGGFSFTTPASTTPVSRTAPSRTAPALTSGAVTGPGTTTPSRTPSGATPRR